MLGLGEIVRGQWLEAIGYAQKGNWEMVFKNKLPSHLITQHLGSEPSLMALAMKEVLRSARAGNWSRIIEFAEHGYIDSEQKDLAGPEGCTIREAIQRHAFVLAHQMNWQLVLKWITVGFIKVDARDENNQTLLDIATVQADFLDDKEIRTICFLLRYNYQPYDFDAHLPVPPPRAYTPFLGASTSSEPPLLKDDEPDQLAENLAPAQLSFPGWLCGF